MDALRNLIKKEKPTVVLNEGVDYANRREKREIEEKAERIRLEGEGKRAKIQVSNLKDEKELIQGIKRKISERKGVSSNSDTLSETDLWIRLRGQEAPARKFGETHEESLLRLMQLEEGSFLDGEFHNKERQAVLDRVAHRITVDQEQEVVSKITIDFSVDPDSDFTIEDDKIVEEAKTYDEKSLVIRRFLVDSIKKWAVTLNERSNEEKRTVEGRLKTALCKQSRIDLKPLHKRLKNKSIDEELMQNLYETIVYIMKEEFILAYDRFIQAAVGNAPWPMGVTMVGIHERAGRSKINSNQIAHILNDDNTRKFIQCLKRLMTYWQSISELPPSRKVSMS